MMAQCVYADLGELLFFMNHAANKTMPAITPALVNGNCITATITATMTNPVIKFDIRFVNSGPSSSELVASCLKKNR